MREWILREMWWLLPLWLTLQVALFCAVTWIVANKVLGNNSSSPKLKHKR